MSWHCRHLRHDCLKKKKKKLSATAPDEASVSSLSPLLDVISRRQVGESE